MDGTVGSSMEVFSFQAKPGSRCEVVRAAQADEYREGFVVASRGRAKVHHLERSLAAPSREEIEVGGRRWWGILAEFP